MKIMKDPDKLTQDKDIRREQITRDTIISELKKMYTQNIVVALVSAAMCLVISLLWQMGVNGSLGILFISMTALFYAALALAVVIGIYYLYQLITCRKRYTVVTDTLIESGTAYNPFLRDGYYFLRFMAYDKFEVASIRASYKEHYTFSRLHRMYTEQLMNRSAYGDEFYLVLVGKRIQQVYNKKIFELIDEE